MSENYAQAPENYSAWAVGWAAFAAIMLIIMGALDIIQGLVAIVNEEFYVVGAEWVFEFNVTTWGWIHLIGGVIVLAAGIGIFSGNVLARTVGVALAALSILWNFAALPYYPIWATIAIAIGVAVIWALTAHGRDIAS